MFRQEIVMSIYRSRMRYDANKPATASDIGSLVVLFGVVGFIVFLAWGAGPQGTRTVAHTPLTRAETTGMGGSYAVPRRAPAPATSGAVELTR
jgi:hypothetical protein